MILIANIGNRNIHFCGVVHAQDAASATPLWPQQNKNFKNDTRFLLEEDGKTLKPEFSDKLGLNILNELLEYLLAKEGLPEKMILVASHQKNLDADRQKQDTIYAAYAVRGLLQKKYPEMEVEVSVSYTPIHEQSDWLKWFRVLIRRLDKKNPASKLIFCDSGGSPQQKQAMKIMAEFMLKPERYSVYYVSQQRAPGEPGVESVVMDEYRTIITQTLVLKLIEKADYSGALNLFDLPDSERNVARKCYLKCLRLGELRMNGSKDNLAKIASTFKKDLLQTNLLLHHLATGQPIAEPPNENLMDLADWASFMELFAKAEFLLEKSEWNQAVLAVQICIEFWFESIMKFHLLAPNSLAIRADNNNRHEILEKVEDILIRDSAVYTDILRRMAPVAVEGNTDSHRLAGRGLPFMVAATASLVNPLLNRISTHLATVLSNNHLSDPGIPASSMHYLNDVRNRIAHKGLQLSQLDHQEANLAYLPEFMRSLRSLLGYQAVNPYVQLNAIIEELILDDR